MEIVVGGFKINIDLRNGTYAFDSDSATGKTFLYKLLSAYSQLNDKVLTSTYTDNKDGLGHKLSLLSDGLVMIDRYDMFCNNDLSLELFSAGKNNIVLIDIKEWNRLPICPCMAEIELREEGVFIYA